MAAAATRRGPAAAGGFRVVMAAVRSGLMMVSLRMLSELLTPVSRIKAAGNRNFGDRDPERGARSPQKSPRDSS